MKSTTAKPSLLSLALLVASQAVLLGVNGAPAKDAHGLHHSIRQSKSWSDSTTFDPPVQVDVVVVGGGFSGMSAAWDLHQVGLDVVVLEAKDRLGGRSRSHKLKSGPGLVELGATWINNVTQPEVFALTQEFGLTTIEQYTKGATVVEHIDGSIVNEADASESEEAAALVELHMNFMLAMSEVIEAIDIRVFDEFPQEEDVTLAEWAEQKGFWEYEYIQRVASQLSTVIVGREPHEIGAHYFFDYVKSGGGFESLLEEGAYGAQSLMIKEGTTSIVNNIAANLPPSSVLTNNPVASITQNSDGTVLVTTATGHHLLAQRAILAIIPTAYQNITFDPPLPASKQSLATESKAGIYAKVVLTYSQPWWREANLVGTFLSLLPTGLIRFSWETSVPEQSQYSLAFFIAGDIATEWHALPESERVEAVTEYLAKLVNDDSLAALARDTLEVNYAEWTKEEYIGGGPTSSMGPGMLRKYGTALRETFGSLHFAGTETAYEWKGYLEGAVGAGKRAAGEVIEALGEGAEAEK